MLLDVGVALCPGKWLDIDFFVWALKKGPPVLDTGEPLTVPANRIFALESVQQ